jgi:hypothetical protein
MKGDAEGLRGLRIVVAATAVIGLVGCTMLSGAGDLVAGDEEPDIVRTRDSNEPERAKRKSAPSSTSPGTPASTGDDDDGADAAEAGSSSPGAPIECGSTTCDAAREVCCVGDGNAKSCIAKGGACGGAVVACGGRSNCGTGEVCCLNLTTASAACTADACTGQKQLIFCRTDADCRDGMKCVATGGSFAEHRACY